jgi:hypothetical protein
METNISQRRESSMSAYLTKELTDLGIKFEEISKDLLLLEDFISQEEIDDYLEIINNTPDEDWFIEYTSNLKRFCMEKFGRDDVDNLVAEGKFEITRNWEDKNLVIRAYPIYHTVYQRLNKAVVNEGNNLELSGLATLQRMQPGVELKAHTDQDTDPSIRYATILYLNDEYTDGELFFKNLDLKIKPKKGSLLIFPGTSDFHHGVIPVGEGPIRYVLVGFIKEKNFYENNKY